MFCPDPLFDLELSWKTTNPNLTQCMRDTVLILIPCGILWLMVLAWICQGRRIRSEGEKTTKDCSRYCITLLSIFLSVVLIANTIGEYFWIVSTQGHSKMVISYYMSRISFLLSLLLVLFVQIYEQKRGIIATMPTSLFWVLLSITMVPTMKFQLENLLEETTWQGLLLFVSFYPCILAQLSINMLPLCFKQRPMTAGLSPVEEATFFSYISFSWMNQLVLHGYRLAITQEQLPNIPASLKPENCAWTFIRNWRKNKQKNDYSISLLRELVWQFKWEAIVVLLIGSMYQTLLFVNPFLLKLLITFAYGEEELWKSYFYIVTLFLTSILGAIVDNVAWYKNLCLTLKIRASLMTLVYRKSLKLSNLAKSKFSIGDITNFMSVDVQTITKAILDGAHAVFSPVKIVLTLYFLFREMGIATLSSIFSIILVIPFLVINSKKMFAAYVETLRHKGIRIKCMNECLAGINILKIYGWEVPFIQRILETRSNEILCMKRGGVFYAMLLASFFFTPLLVNLSLYTTYVLIDPRNVLSAEKIFVSLSLLNMLRFALMDFPIIVVQLLRGVVSIKRIDTFLNAPELHEMGAEKDDPTCKAEINIKNGSFNWNDGETILKNISLHISNGSFTAIVGSVGAGKSSLISAILGEMKKTNGSVSVTGSIGYCPQTSWIQNKTVRGNIMFNHVLGNKDGLYKRIIDACALTTDLETLPAGDDTEIGENGVNISGGQKLRVSLARALYADSDIYLLDDPLSAVDAYVGKHIFDNVLSSQTGILKKKTRVLVTHNLSYLNQVDNIIVLDDGAINEMGTYEQLLVKNSSFSMLLAKQENQMTLHKSDDTRKEHFQDRRTGYISDKDEKIKNSAKNGGLIIDESIEVRSIPFSVYIKYIKALGFLVTISGRSLSLLAFVLTALGSYMLSMWADENRENLDQHNVDPTWYLGMYTLLGVTGVFSYFVSSYIYINSFANAGGIIHKHLAMQLFRSPMNFFQTNPNGRILNIFSYDINAADVEIPVSLGNFVSSVFELTVIFMVVCYVTPFSILVVIVLSIIYKVVITYYIRLYRQLRRLEAVSQSPIFAHFSETLGGTASIRAYKSERYFQDTFELRTEENLVCYYYRISAQRWLNIRVEMLGSVFVAFAALFAIQARDSVTDGLLGLSITYAFMLIEGSKKLCRYLVDTESSSISLERIFDYYHNPQESDWEKPGDLKIASDWPDKGIIEFSNYSTRYREGLDLALRNINLEVASKEKIGICGRTGAGKSTLTLAMLRMIEPTDGRILIDNVDISQLGLHLLRSRLTVIPQDPIIFEGTLRFNLDPLQEYTDEQLWTALEHAHLEAHINFLDGGLDTEIKEGGDNFSVGQRQLICLARALLRKTKILILDEATAAIDIQTDDLVQVTIRKEFEDCTILTIAHRLNTIEDCDRIAVLNDGEIAEIDIPNKLLKNKASAMSQLKHSQN